jgi:rhodanese-related sulfurtransferase
MYLILVLVVGFFVFRMLPAKGVKSVSPAELKDLLRVKKDKIQFIDVREPREYKSGHIPGFRNIPLSQFKSRIGEIQKERPVVVICHSGARSIQASKILLKTGFPDVRNATGGMMKWNRRNARGI